MVQWMDVNQLSQEENLHSKCLCINRLPLDLSDSEELAQFFCETYKPVFCQVIISSFLPTKKGEFERLAKCVSAVKSDFKSVNSLRARR